MDNNSTATVLLNTKQRISSTGSSGRPTSSLLALQAHNNNNNDNLMCADISYLMAATHHNYGDGYARPKRHLSSTSSQKSYNNDNTRHDRLQRSVSQSSHSEDTVILTVAYERGDAQSDVFFDSMLPLVNKCYESSSFVSLSPQRYKESVWHRQISVASGSDVTFGSEFGEERAVGENKRAVFIAAHNTDAQKDADNSDASSGFHSDPNPDDSWPRESSV